MSNLHSLNRDFIWEDRPLTNLRKLSVPQVRQFNESGFCIVKDVVSADLLQELRSEADRFERAAVSSSLLDDKGEELASYEKDELTFTCNLVSRSSVFADFYQNDLFVGVTADLLADSCRLYWDQAVYKHPQKGGEFPWHQDNGYTFVSPQQYLTCWLALSDAPVESGCPWVIPGAHREGTYRHIKKPYGLEIDGVTALIERFGETASPVLAGDMVVFSSLTPHKTGPNLSSDIRKALIIQFIPDLSVRADTDGEVLLNDPVLNPMLTSLSGD